MAQSDNSTPPSDPGSPVPIEGYKILNEEVAPAPVISETDSNALKDPSALDGQFERNASNPSKTIVVKNDGFRELLETIVFVVVLVLVLKSFIAEAFVIPTGSMAETLFGYQKQINCPSCKHRFPVNCSSEVEQMPGAGVMSVSTATCPNCLLSIKLLKHNEESFPGEAAVADPGPSTGDRVLVAKYLYDLPGKGPERLDVVVFKYPGNSNPNEFSARVPASGPQRNHVPMNYIKRLIGLPGETIAIQAGKLYRLPPDTLPPPISNPRDNSDLWMWEFMHENEARDSFIDTDKFEIIRKKPSSVLSMRRIVYDDQHRSADLPNLKRWQALKPNWNEISPSVYVSSTESEKTTSWLRYSHILRNNDSRRQLITDVMGYNTAYHDTHRPGYGDNWVSDLTLEGKFDIKKQEGQLTLELSKGVDRFRAVWNLETGTCTLQRITKDKTEVLAEKSSDRLTSGSHFIRFANVDCRLIIWQDGKLLFNDGVDYKPSKVHGPTLENDLEPASIGTSGTTLSVSELKIHRDTYYTARINPSTPDVSVHDWTEPIAIRPGLPTPDSWKGLLNPPIKTLYVQPGHYLCLGDNSPQSSDGRSWGLVPDNLMMGRAVLIYWPYNRIGRIQ
jgi:signal peptidase I